MYKKNNESLFFRLFFILVLVNSFVHLAIADEIKHNRTYTVGFAQDTLDNDWRRAQVEELRKELSKHHYIKFIVTDAGGKSAKQIQDMEDLAYQKVDVLITSPRDGRASTPAISRIYKQGTPVVLITRSITSNDYTSFITPDDYKIASDAAEFMAEKLSGKGNILMLRGVPTATTAIARTRGFLDTMKKYPGIKVTAIKNANYLRGDAIRAIDSAIREKIPFDAIYSQSDSMAVGARIALKKAGITSSNKLIVGIDYINEAREAIRNGQQAASFIYPTCAKETAQVVLSILHGKKIDKKIHVASKMITKHNVNKITPIF